MTNNMTDNKLQEFTCLFSFQSINRLRKDILGYKTSYKLAITFNVPLTLNLFEHKKIASSVVKREIIDTIAEKDLVGFMPDTTTEKVLDWIVRRLRRNFPQRNWRENGVEQREGIYCYKKSRKTGVYHQGKAQQKNFSENRENKARFPVF